MHPYIHTAIKAVRRAEEILSQGARNPQKMRALAQYQEDTPITLQVQLEAELAIFDILHNAYPDHQICSPYLGQTEKEVPEEDKDQGLHHTEETIWHIHSLDGKNNYQRHIPQFTIELTAEKNGKVTHAVLFIPSSNDLFYAVRGESACLNDRRLKITQLNTETEQRIIALESPTSYWASHAARHERITKQFPHIRVFGSQSISLCYLAMGKIDAFYAVPFCPEQCRAGYLIAKEAGAIISDGQGEPLTMTSTDILAAPPKSFKLLLDLIQS